MDRRRRPLYLSLPCARARGLLSALLFLAGIGRTCVFGSSWDFVSSVFLYISPHPLPSPCFHYTSTLSVTLVARAVLFCARVHTIPVSVYFNTSVAAASHCINIARTTSSIPFQFIVTARIFGSYTPCAVVFTRWLRQALFLPYTIAHYLHRLSLPFQSFLLAELPFPLDLRRSRFL